MIRPTEVHPDGSVDAVYDEEQHTGTVPAEQITWGQGMGGVPNTSMIVLPCPDGCGATSYHPRESNEPLVQEMFARKDTM